MRERGEATGARPRRAKSGSRANFQLPVRVYYEDTDAAGVVYYANYLRFMERARTEWLASIGFDLDRLEREQGIVFVVHRVDIEYRRPAKLLDRLDVTLTLLSAGRATLVAAQSVCRGDETLTQARLTLACLNRETWRPARIPEPLAASFEAML